MCFFLYFVYHWLNLNKKEDLKKDKHYVAPTCFARGIIKIKENINKYIKTNKDRKDNLKEHEKVK